jgi:hypothetical protein
MNDANFKAATISMRLLLNGNIVYSPTGVTGKNAVWTSGSQRITFDTLETYVKYNPVSNGAQITACLDSFFALD